MDKIYQPEIIIKTHEIIDLLINIDFFKDNEIENTDFAKKYLNDKLSRPSLTNNCLRTQIYNARVGTILWNGVCRQCMQGSWYRSGVVG
jgi:hypothetical protein